MTGSPQPAGTPEAGSDGPDTAADGPPVPVAQERSDGPGDIAEFAARLDVDPERDGIKG
jgi:hypothetical protein